MQSDDLRLKKKMKQNTTSTNKINGKRNYKLLTERKSGPEKPGRAHSNGPTIDDPSSPSPWHRFWAV